MTSRSWRSSLSTIVAALLAAVTASCGSGENADQYATLHMGEGPDGGFDDAADGRVETRSLTGQSTLDAPITIDSGASDVLLVDDPSIGERIDATAPVDATGDQATSPDGKGDTAVGSDACSTDVCGSIGIDINVCPEISGFTVNPIRVTAGEDVHLTSSATDGNGDPLVFHWTATQGSFVNANAANTTFHCATTGTATLSLTVSDGRCDDGIDQDVECN